MLILKLEEMKLIVKLFKNINTVVLTFLRGLEYTVAFLTLDNLFVVLAKYFYRYEVKSFTTQRIIWIYMYAVLT